MRTMLWMALCLFPAFSAFGQVEVEDPSLMQPAEIPQTADSLVSTKPSMLYAPDVPTGITLQDSPWGYRPMTFSTWNPMGYMGAWGGGIWDIHQGFNASLSAGVSCGFGKNNPYRGAAFFTDLTGLYAMPIGKRWTVAAGLDYTRYTGWGQSQGSLSLFGLANYRINDRLDATAYISHNFGPMGGSSSRLTASPYIPGVSSSCTTVGADLGIKVSDTFKFNVGFSVTREDNPFMPPMPLDMNSTTTNRRGNP